MSKYRCSWEGDMETNRGGKYIKYLMLPTFIRIHYHKVILREAWPIMESLADYRPVIKNRIPTEAWEMRQVSYRTIAKETGYSRKKVMRIIKGLKAKGLLIVVPGGPGKANRYSLRPFYEAVYKVAKADGYKFAPGEEDIKNW